MSEIPDSKITKGNILPDNNAKTSALSVKVTQLQDEFIKEQAAKRNMNCSEYIRVLLFDPKRQNIVIERGSDIFVKLAEIYDLLVDIKQKFSVKDQDFGQLNGILCEIRSKLDSISQTFEKMNGDISFIFNSIEAVKNGSDSEDEEDDTVYVEDDISDGDIQEGDND